jgi:gliding motility-associated-like protein
MHLILKNRFYIILLLFISNRLWAQSFISNDPFQDHYFIENKGQLKEFKGTPILFELTDKSDKIYILNDGFLWLKFMHTNETGDSVFKTSTIRNQFLKCNNNARVIASGKTKHYFSYGNSQNKSFGYKRLELLNFYPNIDLIYELGKKGEGIKYSFKIRPGGDPEAITFNYSSDEKVTIDNRSNSLYISNSEFEIRESGLNVTNVRGEKIEASYLSESGFISFHIPQFQKGNSILIDPWVKAFNNLNRSNLYSVSLGENIGFDVDYDSKGSVFVYGGCTFDGNQSKLAKYDVNGNLKWVFQGMAFIPNHMITWYSNPVGGANAMGSFVVDRSNDKIYLSDAWGMPKVGNLIIRLDSNGYSDSFLIHHPGLTTANKFIFRCDPHRVVVFGGFNHIGHWSNVFELLDTNVYKPKAFTPKKLNQYEIIMDAVTDDSNRVFVLLKAYSPPYSVTNNSNNVDVLAKLGDSLNSSVWYDTLSTKINQFSIKPYIPTFSTNYVKIGNSTNSIAATKNYIFYYDGKFIACYNKNNGALVQLDSIPQKKQSFQQGIVADNCGNLVVGADSGRLKVFEFNGSSFKWVKDIVVFPNSPRCVLDLSFDKDRNVLVFSGDSMVGTVISPVNCNASKTTEFYVYPQKRCSKFAYAQVEFPDTTKSYTFTWFDSTDNKVVRKVTNFKKYRDTLTVRNPAHSYLVTIKQEDGCYSVVSNFWLSPIPKYDTSYKIILCEGDAYKHNTNFIYRDTQFIDTLITFFGCDSFVRYSLVFNKKSNVKQSKFICAGDTFWIGNRFHTEAGNYSDTLLNFKGCDSIVNTELRVLKDSIFQFKRICDGTNFVIGEKTYTVSGIYIDTFLNFWGCDSIVTTQLIVSRDTVIKQFPQICQGDSIQIGLNVYTKSGLYTDSFKRVSGCDSIVITSLRVYTDTIINSQLSICEGDTVRVGGKLYTQSDIYYDTLQRFTGCDSIIITNLKVLKTHDTIIRILLCTRDSIEINGKFYNSSTQFETTYRNVNGCDSTVTYIINKRNLIADFVVDTANNPAFEFKNLSQEDVKFYWSFGDFTIDSVNRNTSHRYNNDKTYWVNACLTVVDSFGCRDTVCKRVRISKLLYYLFNTFTPGNDGKNDIFRIGHEGGTFNYDLIIYNRWGARVFETINANVADESKFWNGRVMNTDVECPSGSYFAFYNLYLDGPNNPTISIHGVITLLRNSD